MADETAQNKGQEKKDKPPEGDKASHYLVLADGRHIGYQVDDNPDGPGAPFPTEYDGVSVISVHNAR